MNALVLKDLMNLRQSLKTMAIMLLIFAVVFIPAKNTLALYFLLIIFAAMFPLTAMAYDDMVKWDRYALTMPLSRKDVVAGKYLLMLLMLGGAVAVSLAIAAVGSLIAPALFAVPESSFLFILIGGSLGLAYSSILLPVVYRFGTERTRYIMIGSMVAIGALLLGVYFLFGDALSGMGALFWGISPVVAAGMLAVSYRISLRIYAGKEF
ncbi:MAG: ABC-2 transporter permease [Methanocorpusculum sp.]|nr:ABC-2 transporter permease [Methanocorpusculum sp.]